MAKDGTNRGGARIGAGRKKKPLAEKVLAGNPGKRELKVNEFENKERVAAPVATPAPIGRVTPVDGALMPPDFLKLASKETAESYPTADTIFTQVSNWLAGTGCAHLVSSTLIEDFALNRRSFFECEFMNRKMGRIANGKKSPYVDMAVSYAGLMRVAWDRIWAIVAQNSERNYGGGPGGEDVMEKLLNGGTV